jgi:hypothetical protein
MPKLNLGTSHRPWRIGIPSGKRLKPAQYFEAVASHRYVLSPNGDRPDCYRIYEALGLGTIPITELDPYLYDYLKGSGVLFAQDVHDTHWKPPHPVIAPIRSVVRSQYWECLLRKAVATGDYRLRHDRDAECSTPLLENHCHDGQLYRKTFPEDVPGKDGWTTLNFFEVHYKVDKSSFLRHPIPHSGKAPERYAITSSVAECKELCVVVRRECHVYQWDKNTRRCILRSGKHYTLRPNAEGRFYSGHDSHVTAVTPLCAPYM